VEPRAAARGQDDRLRADDGEPPPPAAAPAAAAAAALTSARFHSHLLPPQGCLHAGHLSLVAAARAACALAVASVYVNPTQFAAGEDFSVYPRDEAADLAALEAAGCAAAFAPATLYAGGGAAADDGALVAGAPGATPPPGAHSTWVDTAGPSAGLCAASRPHHFRGVTTVVAKLFNAVEPDKAFFGRKDYQQWRVLERMARDLDFGVEVVGAPIVREADGLAMSSRNGLLTPAHRAAAPALAAALAAARVAAVAGDVVDASAIAAGVRAAVEAAGARVDYVAVVDAHSLRPVAAAGPQETLVAAAAFFGAVRLLDNVEVPAAAPPA
jgi:pantoate--beta-alanine ligase